MISDFPKAMTQVRRLFPLLAGWLLIAAQAAAERINQEGRILGAAPVVATPTLFNTAEADAIVSALQIMPVTNPWNEDISQRPRLANSDAMIAQIKSDLSPTRQTLRAFYEMNYVLVPDNQPRVTIHFLIIRTNPISMAASFLTGIIQFRQTCRLNRGRRARAA